MIHTHSHIDHFGGVLGMVSPEQIDAGEIAIIAPDGYLEHAISENIYAGPAMSRQATYMYGQRWLAPGTEAPAEMHFHIPRYRALCLAENATHTLHNLLTLRDTHVWSRYLSEAIERFGDRTDVLFASHHWPTWGQDQVREFLAVQRDLYGYLHDQTLRLINKGRTGAEIAEEIQLPPAIASTWSTHGYYGSVSHNVKAVYQRYMGWFDGNAARLWPHPPQALAAASGSPSATVSSPPWRSRPPPTPSSASP